MGFMDELKKLTHPYSEPERMIMMIMTRSRRTTIPHPAPQSSRRSYKPQHPAAQDTQTTAAATRS